MKKLIVLFMSLLLLLSCHKSETNTSQDQPGLVGTWKLTETYISPGAGAEIYEPVNSNKTIVIDANGNLTCNGDLCSVSIDSNSPSAGTYSVIDSTITPTGCPTMLLGFGLNENNLIIRFPCIEPCKHKYTKQ